MATLTPTSGAPPTDLDRLRNSQPTSLEAEKARLKKTTKEFESFFLYYMLKTMRETLTADDASKNLPLGGSMGKDTYQQMFDMEISRQMVRGGDRSLSSMLYKSMEKLVEAQYKATQKSSAPAVPSDSKSASTPVHPIQFQRPNNTIQLNHTGTPHPINSGHKPDFSPLSQHRKIATADPIRAQYGKIISEAAAQTKLDTALIHSVIKAESNGNPYAVSKAGAKGLMQLGDSTATDFGVQNPFDPKSNIMGGAKYLRTLMDRYNGDLKLALAAYNAGPGTVEKHGGVPPFRETHDYISRVTNYLKEAGSDEDTPLK